MSGAHVLTDDIGAMRAASDDYSSSVIIFFLCTDIKQTAQKMNLYDNNSIDFMVYLIKVHVFWEGHKILSNLHRRCRKNLRWRFRKSLWPSQNIWNLIFFLARDESLCLKNAGIQISMNHDGEYFYHRNRIGLKQRKTSFSSK